DLAFGQLHLTQMLGRFLGLALLQAGGEVLFRRRILLQRLRGRALEQGRQRPHALQVDAVAGGAQLGRNGSGGGGFHLAGEGGGVLLGALLIAGGGGGEQQVDGLDALRQVVGGERLELFVVGEHAAIVAELGGVVDEGGV